MLVWDLRKVRDQLGILGLDWDAPPYPAALELRDARGPMPPLKAVRVVGEGIDLQARHAAELAEMNRRLTAMPDDPEARIHRGWLYTQQKTWSEAIADLEHRLRGRPGDSDASWLLAKAYLESGKPAGALTALNRLLERAPEDDEARFLRGLVALALAQPALAADDFSRVLAHEPDRNDTRYRRAGALSRTGRHREALADLDVLIAKDPIDFALYDLRSIVREALGDRETHPCRSGEGCLVAAQERNGAQPSGLDVRDRPVHPARPRACCLAGASGRRTGSRNQTRLNPLGVALYRAGAVRRGDLDPEAESRRREG